MDESTALIQRGIVPQHQSSGKQMRTPQGHWRGGQCRLCRTCTGCLRTQHRWKQGLSLWFLYAAIQLVNSCCVKRASGKLQASDSSIMDSTSSAKQAWFFPFRLARYSALSARRIICLASRWLKFEQQATPTLTVRCTLAAGSSNR